jgi:hypothetical protein
MFFFIQKNEQFEGVGRWEVRSKQRSIRTSEKERTLAKLCAYSLLGMT